MIVRPPRALVAGQCSRTYRPLLEAALAATTGPVLELGVGDASTPWLHHRCKDRLLVSIESNERGWQERFACLASPLHRVEFMPYEAVPMMRPDDDAKPWSVVFIDHASVPWRLRDVAWFYHVADIVVVHDTENPYYAPLDWSLFRNVIFDKRLPEWTTAISRHVPLHEWQLAPVANTSELYTEAAVKTWYGTPDRWVAEDKAHDWAFIEPETMIDDKDVLNLGCFYPSDEWKFGARAKSWTAIDFTPEVVARCKIHGSWPDTVSFTEMDMRFLRLAASSIDTVFDYSSGDHLPWEDWQEVVSEVHRVLRPSGVFVVMYANALHHGGPREEANYGYTRWSTPEAMRSSLEGEGFVVVKELTEYLRSGIVVRKAAA